MGRARAGKGEGSGEGRGRAGRSTDTDRFRFGGLTDADSRIKPDGANRESFAPADDRQSAVGETTQSVIAAELNRSPNDQPGRIPKRSVTIHNVGQSRGSGRLRGVLRRGCDRWRT